LAWFQRTNGLAGPPAAENGEDEVGARALWKSNWTDLVGACLLRGYEFVESPAATRGKIAQRKLMLPFARDRPPAFV
jgi:hypothetical protein